MTIIIKSKLNYMLQKEQNVTFLFSRIIGLIIYLFFMMSTFGTLK